MQIVVAQPPNIDAIRKVFTFTRRVIFCYGDVIYNPDDILIHEPMVRHEEVHQKQQAAIGVEAWWDKYLADKEFRAQQEIPAYRAQYRARQNTQIDASFRYARALAQALSGDTYGECISYQDAFRLITA